MTCDAVDGKHARNTKQSTPLGAVAPWLTRARQLPWYETIRGGLRVFVFVSVHQGSIQGSPVFVLWYLIIFDPQVR